MSFPSSPAVAPFVPRRDAPVAVAGYWAPPGMVDAVEAAYSEGSEALKRFAAANGLVKINV